MVEKLGQKQGFMMEGRFPETESEHCGGIWVAGILAMFCWSYGCQNCGCQKCDNFYGDSGHSE